MKIRAIQCAMLGLCSGLIVAPLLSAQPVSANVSSQTTKKITKAVLPKESTRIGNDPVALGYDYLQKGWADAAIEAFQTAIQRNPTSVKAHLGLAQSYEKNGAIQNAWQSYQTVVQLEPENRTALQRIGSMGEYRPEWQPAGIASLTTLLKQDENHGQARLQRALLLGYQGQFEAAWQDYAKLNLDNFPLKALQTSAEAAGFSGRPAIAVDIYDRILQQIPDDTTAKLQQAYFGVQSQRFDTEKAQKVFEQWLAQEPADITSAAANLAGVLPANPEWQNLYNRILAKFPRQLTIHQRALQVLATKDSNSAQRGAMQLVRANPNTPYAYFIQGDIARRTGNLDLAAQAYAGLLAKQPGQVDALMSLGGVRFEQRRFEEAQAIFMQIISNDRNHLEARKVLADLYATQDQPIAALELLRQVAQINADKGINDPQLKTRIAQLEYTTLRRRSFQTPWEGY